MELNYFPIKFEFENFQIDKTPYSDDILKSLRKSYNATHSFFRNGDDIYVSNYNSEQQLDIKLTSDQKNIYTDYPVTASLIKHLFFRNFKDRFVSFTSVDFYPFRFFSSKDKDDLIYHLLPSELKGRIGYKKMIEVQMRLTNINGIKQFGFIVNIERNWIFDKNCAALHFEGYDLTGVEVLHTEIFPGSGNVLAPNEDYIGSILQTDGESAKVATNEGEKVYPLSELFIRKTKFNIGNYLDFATSSSKSTEILEHIENRRHEIYNTKSLYGEITEIAKALFSNKLDGSAVGFQNKDGFYFTVQDTPLQVSNTFELKTPTFIFDPAATKTNNVSPDLGLTNFGPYDSINFDIKSPNILGICHRENRGHFSNFGHETGYGTFTGNFDLLNALGTLAYEGRRRELFAGEFLNTLLLMQRGVARDQLKGSWAGATGYPQFLPSVYLRLARDGDGDGKADIWRSEPDALASIGNYLRDAGWKKDVPWGVAVRVPEGIDRAAIRSSMNSPRCPRVFARQSRWLTIAEWRDHGLTMLSGRVPAENELATLIEPDGPGRTGYLLTTNYRSILDYNCSNFYALSVGLLGDAIVE